VAYPALDDALGSECESFLAGRWAAEPRDHPAPLPRWAWLNLIAHGDIDSVRDAAAVGTPGSASWSGEDIQVVLARAVLAAVAPEDLPRIQREILVPLEIRVMTSVMSPRRVVELVGAALYEV
jgi:hypothetical protein